MTQDFNSVRQARFDAFMSAFSHISGGIDRIFKVSMQPSRDLDIGTMRRWARGEGQGGRFSSKSMTDNQLRRFAISTVTGRVMHPSNLRTPLPPPLPLSCPLSPSLCPRMLHSQA